jgi:hypothetical protein
MIENFHRNTLRPVVREVGILMPTSRRTELHVRKVGLKRLVAVDQVVGPEQTCHCIPERWRVDHFLEFGDEREEIVANTIDWIRR